MIQIKKIHWLARIFSLAIMLFGLPFYFGYGNPLPFINSDYTFWDNFWLCVFPLMFIGLGLGWKWKKIGGLLVVIPITIGLLFGIIIEKEIIFTMLFPLFAGVLYLLADKKSSVRNISN